MLGKHTLKPGEKTELRMVFDTQGNPGPFRKTATLTTDMPGQEETEATITGMVKEAPGAKIHVAPRRILADAAGLPGGKKQAFTVVNKGALPLVMVRIYSQASGAVYFDGSKEGNIVVGPGGARKVEIDLGAGDRTGRPSQEIIAIESNARNAPKTGYVIIIEHGPE